MTASPAPRSRIDRDHLHRVTDGDGDLQRELLGLFEQQCRALLPIFARDGGADQWSAASHALKGAALAIGAFGVADAADAVELGCEAARPDVDSLVRTLQGAVAELRRDLRDERPR